MYFEDNFNYSQNEVNNIIILAFLTYIKKVLGSGKKVVNSNKLIEAALKKLNISSFDFINDNSIMIINEGLTTALKFLVEEELISSVIRQKDRFYKFFISKQLFSSHEFSNEFEDNLVLTLLYKLDFSFSYLISDNFSDFFKTYLTHTYIICADKIINVYIGEDKPIKILVLPKNVTKKYLIKAINAYDYTTIADYIGFYDKTKNVVRLYSVNLADFNEDLLKTLTIAVNTSGALKSEFKII